MRPGAERTVHRVLAAAALGLGALAAVAGDPARPRDIEPIGAVELGRWLMERRPGLRVLDLRDSAAVADFALPGARRADDAGLDTLDVAARDTIVVYAEADALAERAARRLAGRGAGAVRWLPGGTQAWLDDVIDLTIAADASERERAAFAEAAEVSRYFGGMPRVIDAGARDAATVRTTRRRGCGF